MAEASDAVVTIHGCMEKARVVYMGGRDAALSQKIMRALIDAGFSARQSSRFPGINPLNICNRSRRGMGVQLEISAGLRRQMFEEITRIHRKKTTPLFDCFVRAVRAALADWGRERPGRPEKNDSMPCG